jgi:hypothetical protein
VELVADGIAVPLRYHWYVGSGDPEAVKVNTAVLPEATVWEVGCAAAVGAFEGTVSEMTVAE